MMQTNSAFCAYEGFYDEVSRVYGDPANSLWDEAVYTPPQTSESGRYYPYLNEDLSVCDTGYYEEPNLSDEFYDYHGTPQMPSYHCGSPFADYQDDSYDTYHYDYNVVYYLQPAYLIYYPVIPVQHSAVYTYLPCYEYVPVYCQDYVLNYNYSVPTTTCYGSESNFIYPEPVYESPLLPSPVEPNVLSSEEFDYDLYNIENSYLIYYPVINVEYSAVYTYLPCYEYASVYCQDFVLNYNYSVPTSPCYVSDSNFIYPDPVNESALASSPVKPNVFPSEELDFDLYNIENRYSNDKYERFAEKVGEEITTCYLFYEEYPEKLNGGPVEDEANSAATPGKKTSLNGDTLEEFSTSRKSCSAVNDRRKKLSASSQVKKTFINRGVVADPSEYRKFCESVENRLKKLRETSPEKKTTTDRDAVKASHRKFWSTVEERREILNSSSVRQKTYVNRGVVADPSSYRNFCQSVENKIKKLGPSENSQSFEVKDFIVKQGSKVSREKRVVHEESSHSLMDMILKSAEYLHVEDNIKNPKHYSDILYKQALKKQNKTILMDILPSIIEESFTVDDVTAIESCGELDVTEPRELNSNDERKPEITKTKQPKNRLKSFRNWLAKTFCCCCTTNQPP